MMDYLLMKLRIKRLTPEAELPTYAHGPQEDAGMDLRSVAPVLLEPGVPQAVPTGLAIEVPAGFEAQVRMRSGLALRHALILPTPPGTIAPGYRGELRVIILTGGREPYQIHAG